MPLRSRVVLFQERFLQQIGKAREVGDDGASPWADEQNSQLFLHGFQGQLDRYI